MPLRPADIHYSVYGDKDAPPVVLIHGLDATSASFLPIIPALSERYRVIVYDQRGHGLTQARGPDYSLSLLAKDLAALLDHLKVDKAHVIGHSYGARTAMKFSELFPKRVLSMIVEDMEMIPRLVDPLSSLRKARALQNLPRTFASEKEMLQALRPLYGSITRFKRARQNPDGTFSLLFNPYASVLYGYYAGSADLTEALVKFAGPLLFVRADPRLAALTDKGAAHIARNRPDAKVVTIAGASHNVHGSMTEEFLEAALGFLQGR